MQKKSRSHPDFTFATQFPLLYGLHLYMHKFELFYFTFFSRKDYLSISPSLLFFENILGPQSFGLD